MKNTIIKVFLISIFLIKTVFAIDPLPSWNNTTQKKSIIAFVEEVTKKDSPNFVSISKRIAVFDNDGTLWPEQPLYFPQAFAFDRIKMLASQNPKFKNNSLYRKILDKNMQTLDNKNTFVIDLELELQIYANYTVAEIEKFIIDWSNTARHPITGRLYTEMVYQPMLELITYLRNNNFKIFIVSGSWTNFMRPITEKIYGIPSEQIIGSELEMKLEMREAKPTLVYLPIINLYNIKDNKVFSIYRKTGQCPIIAFGNSDNDLEMLRWVAAGDSMNFVALVHHTDSVREWSYDRTSSIGQLDKALDEAHEKNWSIIDMKKDWKIIYPLIKNNFSNHY